MDNVLLADERGRVTLGSKIIDRYGKKYIVIIAEKEITLVPLKEDPLKKLKKMSKEAGLEKYGLKKLKRIAEEEAIKNF